jgi:hypothetical protein
MAHGPNATEVRPMLSLAVVLLASGAASPPPDQWVLVAASDYLKAAAPLIAHRRSQGLRVVVASTTDLKTAPQVRKKIARASKSWPGRTTVLLLGAVSSPHAGRMVPTCLGTISRMKGQPTDVLYGCLDGTRLPTVAVGRMPARDEAEARAMVQKTIAMEKAGPGAWKRRITVLAGIPAFNAVVDRLVESAAFARFDRISPEWTGKAVYTSPSSRFCVPDAHLGKRCLDYLANGQAITMYLGHSNASALYAGDAPFLSRLDFAKAKMPHGGIFITLGCNGCQLRGRDGEGYGVFAIRNPTGPAGVIGPHGISFAAMGNLASDGVFEAALANRLPTRLGDCYLAALNGIANGKIDFFTYRALDAVDGDPNIPQATQRQEHLEMFVLLGDPALRLPTIPNDIRLNAPSRIAPAKGAPVLNVKGALPKRLAGANVEIIIERTPASVPVGLAKVPTKGAKRDELMLANHELANKFTLARKTLRADGISFAAKLTLPEKLPWPKVLLRVRAWKGDEEALVARRLEVGR